MTVVESHGIVHLVGEPDDIWNVAASDASDDEAGEAQGPVGGVQSYEAKVVYPGWFATEHEAGEPMTQPMLRMLIDRLYHHGHYGEACALAQQHDGLVRRREVVEAVLVCAIAAGDGDLAAVLVDRLAALDVDDSTLRHVLALGRAFLARHAPTGA